MTARQMPDRPTRARSMMSRRSCLRGVLVSVAALALFAGFAAGGATPAVSAPGATTAATDYGRMLLVLDSSGSMKEPAGGGTTKIAAAKSALDDVVGSLPDDADVGLRVFGATVFSRSQKGACTDSQLVVAPGTGNRDALQQAVASYRPYGETPIAYALQQAAKDLGSEGTRSIVLVSDGIATCQPDPCDVAGKIAAAGIDLQIDVVGLGVSGKAREQLRCIASRGKGTYYDADSASDISSSLTKAADRAVKPFQFDGTPISGGTTSDDATPVTAGVWQDVLARNGQPESQRWYRYERRIKGSTLLVGTTLLGNKVTDAAILSVVTEDGTSCDLDATGTVGVRTELYSLGVAAGPGIDAPDPDDACQSGPLLIKVEHQTASVFGRRDARYSMRIAEEPPVEDPTSLPVTIGYNDPTFDKPDVDDTATPVTGGQSLGDATTLTDGSYTGSIVPGESQIFQVKVGWGQQLSALVQTPAATPALQETGVVGGYGNLQVLNPLGVDTPDDLRGADPSFQTVSRSGPDQGTYGTIPVRWSNRDGISTTYLAGSYYLVVNADQITGGASAEMPYTLRVQVQGEVSGAPTYVDGAALLTSSKATKKSGPGAVSDKQAKPVSRTSRDDGGLSTPVKLVAAGGLGVVALLCCGLAVQLLRRA